MGLEQQLDEFKEECLRAALAGRAALYEANIEELRTSFAREAAVGRGTKAPEFRLPVVASLLAIPVPGEVLLPAQCVAIVVIRMGVCLSARRPSVRSIFLKRPTRGE